VQVKSTIFKRRGDCYSLNVMGPKRKPYAPGTVDFFAILLIPIDDWYIIPFEALGRKNSTIHFTPKSKRQKYGKFQEAWGCCGGGDWDLRCGAEGEGLGGEGKPGFLAGLGMRKFFCEEKFCDQKFCDEKGIDAMATGDGDAGMYPRTECGLSKFELAAKVVAILLALVGWSRGQSLQPGGHRGFRRQFMRCRCRNRREAIARLIWRCWRRTTCC